MILVALILILFKITAATALVQLVREKESNIVMIQSELYTPCCYRDQSKAVCQKGYRCKCLCLWMCLSDLCNVYGYKGKKGGGIHAVVNKRANHCGRKRVEIPTEAITSIPFEQRTTLEDLARALGLSKSTVHKHLREGKIERHSSSIKPYLTDENNKAQVQHALNMLEPSTIPHQPVFRHMYNVIHADEKWYYRTRSTQKFYCAPGEERPRRTCKSKNYIEKVMFFGGQSRPWFNEQNECTFDGKIGI